LSRNDTIGSKTWKIGKQSALLHFASLPWLVLQATLPLAFVLPNPCDGGLSYKRNPYPCLAYYSSVFYIVCQDNSSVPYAWPRARVTKVRSRPSDVARASRPLWRGHPARANGPSCCRVLPS